MEGSARRQKLERRPADLRVVGELGWLRDQLLEMVFNGNEDMSVSMTGWHEQVDVEVTH